MSGRRYVWVEESRELRLKGGRLARDRQQPDERSFGSCLLYHQTQTPQQTHLKPDLALKSCWVQPIRRQPATTPTKDRLGLADSTLDRDTTFRSSTRSRSGRRP